MSLIEEIMNELEKERNKKTLNELVSFYYNVYNCV